ncbi:hypothetical protein KR222_003785, partial [Zaprionus bogoriensis]
IALLKDAGAKPEDLEMLMASEPRSSKIEMRIIPAMYPKMGYQEKNERLGRHISPHLSIYKVQLTSALSILLRISGFALGLGIWVVGFCSLFGDIKIEAMVDEIEKCECEKNYFNIAKFCLLLPFSYHIVAGTRHLIWHLNVFLSKPMIYATGYVAIALTFIMAFALSSL